MLYLVAREHIDNVAVCYILLLGVGVFAECCREHVGGDEQHSEVFLQYAASTAAWGEGKGTSNSQLSFLCQVLAVPYA